MTISRLINAAKQFNSVISVVKKQPWQTWAIIVAIACVAIWIVLVHPSCGTNSDTEAAQQQLLDEYAKEREEMNQKLDELQAELFEYQEQLRIIDDEIRASTEERERIHEEIDDATTISGIDAALRAKRISSKRRTVRTKRVELKRPSETEDSARGLDTNPYR